ncbi:MAG: hypothetical protein DRI57_00260, partial [Deltaproteobacteria bacterium]
MKRYGTPNLIQSDVKSDKFASDNPFNKLVVNSLSEVDQGTLDHDVIIFNKEDDKIYTYSPGSDGWIPSMDTGLSTVYDKLREDSVIYIDDVQDIYNEFEFDTSIDNHLAIHPDMLDLGDIGSPVDCVIDFWLKPAETQFSGTMIYNGQNTGQVDLDQNKNFLLTTHGVELIKDPNYQDDPTIIRNNTENGYIHCIRPALKSISRIFRYTLVHVAIIRSGDTTYLAINGKIEDSAESVEYYHYDDVLIGVGYYGTSNGKLINLRVTKGTDLGWTTDFIPPNHNITPDANTHFLMDSTSVVDTMGNHSINVVGDAPSITQDRFYYQLPIEYNGCTIKTNLSQD